MHELIIEKTSEEIPEGSKIKVTFEGNPKEGFKNSKVEILEKPEKPEETEENSEGW